MYLDIRPFGYSGNAPDFKFFAKYFFTHLLAISNIKKHISIEGTAGVLQII